MATINPEESTSPARTPPRSSQKQVSTEIQSPPPRSAHIGSAKTEVPRLPDTFYTAFQKPKLDPLAEGSKAIELAKRLEGKLGLFWSRDQGDVPFTYLDINIINFRAAVRETLFRALHRLIRNKGFIEDPYIIGRTTVTADFLADGVMMATYLKLRTICGVDAHRMARFCRKPKVPAPFELPRPFALAITQLGIVEVSSLETRRLCCPSASDADCQTFFLPAARQWNVPAYAEAVEVAKSVGMEFIAPDLRVKLGSSWWLHSHTSEATFQSINCLLPEDNFTESTAVLYSMFCHGQGVNFGTDLFNLGPIGTDVYEQVIVAPHSGINVNAFFAIADDPNTQLWKIDS